MKQKWKSLIMPISFPPHGRYSPWNSPGQNTGVGSQSLLQGIFPTQESNQGLLHCGWILYQLSHQGSLIIGHKKDKEEGGQTKKINEGKWVANCQKYLTDRGLDRRSKQYSSHQPPGTGEHLRCGCSIAGLNFYCYWSANYYWSHLMRRADSLENTLMLGNTEGRRRGDRGRDDWVTSPIQQIWIWASSGRWWGTGKPGVLQSMGHKRIRHDLATRLQQLY